MTTKRKQWEHKKEANQRRTNMITAQELFDNALHGVLKQGGQSFDKKKGCVYRDPSGRRCGIGHSIPDAEYSSNFEGVPVITMRALCSSEQPVTRYISTNLLDLAQSLQHAHDRHAAGDSFLYNFEVSMKGVADRYDLQTPPWLCNRDHPDHPLRGGGHV